MFGFFKIYLLSYWRGSISVSDILSLFSLEIHVFTHRSSKSQFWVLLSVLLEWQNFVMQASPNSCFITVTWSLVFTCNCSRIKLVSIVNHKAIHIVLSSVQVKTSLKMPWSLNFARRKYCNCECCKYFHMLRLCDKIFNTYIVTWWSSRSWIYP